MVLYILIQLS